MRYLIIATRQIYDNKMLKIQLIYCYTGKRKSMDFERFHNVIEIEEKL